MRLLFVHIPRIDLAATLLHSSVVGAKARRRVFCSKAFIAWLPAGVDCSTAAAKGHDAQTQGSRLKLNAKKCCQQCYVCNYMVVKQVISGQGTIAGPQ